ncbi:MAG: MarR family winged helix-turn-helix transcriptional regulator [Coprococcus sp.]
MAEKCILCGDDLGLLIMRTATMIRRHADANVYMSRVKKITGANGWIMRYLNEKDGEDVYPKDIEEKFGVTRSTVSRVLKGMEAKGLIYRESVSGDARLKKIILTEEGRRINQHAAAECRALEDRVKSGLSDEEIRTLERLLKKIADNMCDK